MDTDNVQIISQVTKMEKKSQPLEEEEDRIRGTQDM